MKSNLIGDLFHRRISETSRTPLQKTETNRDLDRVSNEIIVSTIQLSRFFSPNSDSYRGSYFQKGGEGDEPLWRIGRGTRVPLQGAVDVVPLLGAIVGCHCSVLSSVVKGEGDDGSGRGAIAGCHCKLLWLGGGWTWCHCWVPS